MEPDSTRLHPAAEWERDARRLRQSSKLQLRLAAMAGHMHTDRIASRRAAVIDLLSDGRPYTREKIWEAVAARLGQDCWGKLPQEALARDLSVLREAGIRIAYSRRPKATGYYLQHPHLERPSGQPFEAVNWELVAHIGRLSLPEKNERAFAAADFALRQKRLILSEEHPGRSPDQVEREARRLVYGVSSEEWA